MFIALAFMVLIVPLLIVMVRSRSVSADTYAFNNGSTGLLPTLGSIICGNVGIGTFVAIYLFTKASPVIGLSIVCSYIVGLFLCSLLAKRIHEVSRQSGTYSLVDLIAHRHGTENVMPIWMPVAFVFIMRSAVQLTALAIILGEAFGIGFSTALFLSTLIAGSYTMIGGYKAATETDFIQAIVIIVLMAFVILGIGEFEVEQRAFFDLGPYKPILLIGIFAFVPLSPVLAVDNWQRMATAKNARTASRAYALAAFLCGTIYFSIWWVGMLPSQTDDVLQTFRTLMPAGTPWLADILFMTCILSSIDTFVMPLVSTFANKGKTVWQLRFAVAGLFSVVGLVSWLSGDLLNNIIAAFNSLSVFLPAVLGAFLLDKPSQKAAFISLNGGIVLTLLVTMIDLNLAALVGFAFSAVVYWLLSRKQIQQSVWTNAGRSYESK